MCSFLETAVGETAIRAMNASVSADSIFTTAGVRPFLVGVDEEFGRAHITVHAARSAMSRRQAWTLKRQLRSERVFARCRVKRYSSAVLDRARTVEAFLAPFMHDQILYDPTGAFERARKLVDFAGALRRRLEHADVSLLWQARNGTLYVVLGRECFSRDVDMRRADLAAVESIVRQTIVATCGPRAAEFVRGARIGFSVPDVPVTPIDKYSVDRDAGLVEKIKVGAAASTVAALVGLSTAGLANAG